MTSSTPVYLGEMRLEAKMQVRSQTNAMTEEVMMQLLPATVIEQAQAMMLPRLVARERCAGRRASARRRHRRG